ncbi:hypothetical protein CDAR_308481 [Caerostris darwini]|uniref:Uncharacterized protein n=1 Tax=Caerostris darwini TaxID=1538125 RepID=A0AAV4S3E6_9ARAC|nr:hypothetical protein CDAR_308481 [Caerostris darwini]
MEILFHGKRALVTGAGKGIGRAMALKLAECGAEVVAVSRTQSDLDALKKERKCRITVNGFTTTFKKSDAADPTPKLDVGNWEVTKNALKGVGPIDLLVSNAGIMDTKLQDLRSRTSTDIAEDDMKARGKEVPSSMCRAPLDSP